MFDLITFSGQVRFTIGEEDTAAAEDQGVQDVSGKAAKKAHGYQVESRGDGADGKEREVRFVIVRPEDRGVPTVLSGGSSGIAPVFNGEAALVDLMWSF